MDIKITYEIHLLPTLQTLRIPEETGDFKKSH